VLSQANQNQNASDPRPVTRGSTCNATLDWVRMTGPESVQTALLNWAEKLQADQETGETDGFEDNRGLWGYASGRYWGSGKGGMKVLWGNPGSTCTIEFPGGELSRWALDEQIELVDQLHTLGMTSTNRIDLALDYTSGDDEGVQTFLDEAIAACKAGALVSPRSFLPIEPYTNKLERKGLTLYLGSVKSELMVRIYDKGQETGEKDAGRWIRLEAQFKDSKADAVTQELLRTTADNSAQAVMGLALGAVEFDNAGCSDALRATGSETEQSDHTAWLRAIAEGVELIKVRTVRARSTFEGWRDNFIRTNGRRIREMAYLAGISPDQVVAQLVADLKPSKPTRMDDVLRESSVHLTT